MFLNRLKSRLFVYRKVSTLNLIENRFTHIPSLDSSNVSLDIRRCELIWKRQRNLDSLYKHVHECFTKNGNSPIYITNVMRLACQSFSYSHELLYNFIKVYNEYIENNPGEHSLTTDQKILLLRSVLEYKNFKLLKLTCDVLKIKDEKNFNFKEFISDLLSQEKVAEAANCISALNLQEEFPIEKITLLLLHDNKWEAAIFFLKDSPELQLATAKFLDSFLEKRATSTKDISMRSRQAYRFLSSIIKKYKIPTAECKNLHFIRSKGAINILVRRKSQQSISASIFEEMVMNVVGDNQFLKEHLLCKLLSYNDKTTAIRMKEKLNVLDFDLDSVSVIPSLDSIAQELDEAEEEIEKLDEDSDNLALSLSVSDIKFIDSKAKFKECVADLSENYPFIGIDTEWKPQFGLNEDRLSLIQLAGHNKVYILDVIALSEKLDSKDWDELSDKIFSNPKIVKLGCSIMTDIQMIVDNKMGTKGKTLRFTHILDMAIFYQKLQEVYPAEMEKDEDTQNLKGLSQLCKIILGKPLNKEVRLCDWEKRPLADSQLEYAALDAHCLVEMYDELRKTSLEKNMNFDHLAKVAMVLTTSYGRSKKKIKKDKRTKSIQNVKTLPIQEFKVAVQLELEQLSERLTELGADVLILNKDDKASDAALIAQTQSRTLICLEDFKTKVLNLFPEIVCFGVNNFTEDKTRIEEIVYKILLWCNVRIEMNEFSSAIKFSHSKESVQITSDDMNSSNEVESKSEDAFIKENKLSSKT